MKTIRFNCQHCSQKIEAPQTMAGQLVVCPTCGKDAIIPLGSRFAIKSLLRLAIVALLLIAACKWLELREMNRRFPKENDHVESHYEKMRRWEKLADAAITNSCDKEIVGFKRVIDSYVSYEGENPSDWYGKATVDYINPVGGVSRTNLTFIFGVSGEGDTVFASIYNDYGDADKKPSWRKLMASVAADKAKANAGK